MSASGAIVGSAQARIPPALPTTRDPNEDLTGTTPPSSSISSSSSSLPEGAITTSGNGASKAPGPVGGPSGGSSGSNSDSIPPQVSIPVQFQNGHIEVGGADLSQQMSDMDLNSVQSVTSSQGGGGFVDYSSQGNRGGFGGQSFTGSPLMYSDNYTQGALYLGSYSNPMLTSWQYNPNQPNQGLK